MAELEIDPNSLLGDRGHDSEAIRNNMRIRGGTPEIPTMQNRRLQPSVKRAPRALRNRIERSINRLKNRRRVATRYDHTATSFLGFSLLAAVRQWIRFVRAGQKKVTIILIGRSGPAVHALRHLDSLGVGHLQVFSDRVASDLLDVAGRRLVHRLPSPAEIERSARLIIADLPPGLAAPLVTAAHVAGVPVEHHQEAQRIAPGTNKDAVTAFSEPCLIYAF